MKDAFVLCALVLLSIPTTKVGCQGYPPDSDGKCRDITTEYLSEDTNLCCKKCPPGERQVHHCNETAERACVPCAKGQFMEGLNFSPTCRTCFKCKEIKGLQYAQTCTSTRKALCVCQPGRFCIMGFNDPYCTECVQYQRCRAGYGVSVPGTANSNVHCAPCPDGTFSDSDSYSDLCRPHTNCHRRPVVRNGSATLDTVCEAEDPAANTASETSTEQSLFISEMTTMKKMVEINNINALQSTDATSYITLDVSETGLDQSTKNPVASTVSGSELAAAIASAAGLLILAIVVLLVCLYKKIWNKDATRFHPKVDANGNCQANDKINEAYLGETKLTSFTVTSPEQQCLLEKSEACSHQSQSSSNTESLTRTEGCSSEESIGPLQPTMPLQNLNSDLSEPMPLLSQAESDNLQSSIQTELSSQPTSLQIISPVTPSPQVNVNITFNIGNGTAGTPSVTPVDLLQEDSKLPFGEEEESFSIPQQEAGKQSLISVQESKS